MGSDHGMELKARRPSSLALRGGRRNRSRLAWMPALIAACFVGAALAQTPLGSEPQPQTGLLRPGDPVRPGAPGPASAASTVDESALRYFAAQGDQRRLEAELSRLRALYPGWTAPDLSRPPDTRDAALEGMWSLFAEGRYAEARAALAARREAEPRWEPPADLVQALDEAEARRRLANAAEAGQWRSVLAIATETPSLLTCAHVDTLWRVAEAFARSDQADRARDAYVYVLTNCPNAQERLASVQKALDLLPEARLLDLLRLERAGEFAPIRDELARRRVAKASLDPKQTASAEDLAVTERLAQTSAAADNMLLLGWYHYTHSDSERALPFFEVALSRNGGPKAAEGRVLALHALKRFAEAEAAGYDWRERSADNMRVYLEAVNALFANDPPLKVEGAVVGRAIPVILKEQDAIAAQGLAWYAYNTCQARSAGEWFERSLGWKPDDEASAYGLAVSRERVQDRRGFLEIALAWRARSDRIDELITGRKTGTHPCDDPFARDPGLRDRYESRQRSSDPAGRYDDRGSRTLDQRLRSERDRPRDDPGRAGSARSRASDLSAAR